MQKSVVGLRVPSAAYLNLTDFVADQLDLKLLRYRRGHIGLNGQNICKFAIIGLRPKMKSVLAINELNGNSHGIPSAAHAPLEDRTDIQLACNPQDIGICAPE